MEKLRIGIIGTGNIANWHANGYKVKSDLAELVSCCDIDENKAKAFAEKHGIPTYYGNLKDMLKNEKLDAVSVCTWNAAHKECTVAALNAGLHVLCEKPMAMNAKEAEEMISAAKKNNRHLQIGFVRRFGKDADTVIDYCKDGTMGDIYYAKAQYTRRDGCPGGWFKDKRFSGGGPLIDLGVHVIDLCRYLAGNPKPVCAFGITFDNLGPNRAKGGPSAWAVSDINEHPYTVEDFAGALIKFDNGFTLQLDTSFNLNIPQDIGGVQVFGTKAGARIYDGVELSCVFGGRHAEIKPCGDTKFDFVKAFNAEIENFIVSANKTGECRATMEDGLLTMKIVDAIYKSAKTGKSVEIK